MDEYQSIEMHHGAVARTYKAYDDDDINYNGREDDLVAKKINDSAFSGGHIAFIDNEDISFYTNKLKTFFTGSEADADPAYINVLPLNWLGYLGGYQYLHGVGPPVEIDHKYLSMILGTKKLKVSVEIDFTASTDYKADYPQYTGDDEQATMTGTIEGSFDGLDFSLEDSFFTDYTQEGGLEHSAAWYRRNISSKAAQLNPLDRIETMSEYASYDDNGSVTHPIPTSGNLASLLYNMAGYWSTRHALPKVGFSAFINLIDSNGPMSRDYSASGGNEKSGNYSVDLNASGNFELMADHNISVPFIVVTPTKVYAFPNISGFLHVDIEGSGIRFTAVKSNTYPTYNKYYYGESGSLPPLGVSTMTFLGASVPIYFYYIEGSMNPENLDDPYLSYTASGGGSFDISVEESY